MAARKRALPAKRRELLIHAGLVLSHVKHAIRVLKSPSSTEADVDGISGYVGATYRAIWKNEIAHRWMTFARAVDSAARIAAQHFGREYDAERANAAREYFARLYPAAAEKIDDEKMLAAVRAWREQSKHWTAVHRAVRCFGPAPTARSMSREWQKFPHRPPPSTNK